MTSIYDEVHNFLYIKFELNFVVENIEFYRGPVSSSNIAEIPKW